MSERERFEAWARTQPRHEGASMRFLPLNNAYIDFDLHGAWLAWQAARSGQTASGSSQGARSDYPEAAALLCERFARDFTTTPPKNEFEHGVQTATTRLAEAFRRQPEAPTAAPPETEAWMIVMSDGRKRVFQHNAIGDYRLIDPEATVVELVPRARSGAGSEEGGAT